MTNRHSSFKVIKYEDNKLSLIKDYLISRGRGHRTISDLSSNKIYYNGHEDDTVSVEKAYEELKKDLTEINLAGCLAYDNEGIEQYYFIDGKDDNISDVLISESRFNSSDYVSSYSRFFKDYTNLRDKIKIEKQTNNKENISDKTTSQLKSYKQGYAELDGVVKKVSQSSDEIIYMLALDEAINFETEDNNGSITTINVNSIYLGKEGEAGWQNLEDKHIRIFGDLKNNSETISYVNIIQIREY